MFKLAGGILVLCSTVFISSQQVLKYYFTYRFLQKVADTIKTIQYENATNMPYTQVFKKISFDKDMFFSKAKSNGYILHKEIETAKMFFDNLGRRDKIGETEYLNYNFEVFTAKSKEYCKRYNEIKKTHILCGIAVGLFIIIFLA